MSACKIHPLPLRHLSHLLLGKEMAPQSSLSQPIPRDVTSHIVIYSSDVIQSFLCVIYSVSDTCIP